jgi:hypothetical protein
MMRGRAAPVGFEREGLVFVETRVCTGLEGFREGDQDRVGGC